MWLSVGVVVQTTTENVGMDVLSLLGLGYKPEWLELVYNVERVDEQGAC